jgi:hypothetical protein
MKTFQLPASLESYRSNLNKTLKLTFETSEISPESMANIHYSLYKVGYLAFSPDPFATAELDEIDKLKVEFTDTGKPPSQRLRAVLYRLWEQAPEGFKTFNEFYNSKMEVLINHFKDKLV